MGVMIGKTKGIKSYDIGRNPVSFQKRNQAGVHFLIDFWFGKIIEDKKRLKNILVKAGKKSKSTPLRTSLYKFSPRGITGVVILAESHIAIHSWPEINYLGIDIFTCGEKTQPHRAFEYLKKEFQPKRIEVKTIKRGVVKDKAKRIDGK